MRTFISRIAASRHFKSLRATFFRHLLSGRADHRLLKYLPTAIFTVTILTLLMVSRHTALEIAISLLALGTLTWIGVSAFTRQSHLALHQKRMLRKMNTLIENTAKERAFMEEIMENIQEIIWVLDVKTFHLIYLSPRASNVFGRPIEEMLNSMAFIESVLPDDQKKLIGAIEMGIEIGRSNCEYRLRMPGGQLKWVYSSGYLNGDKLTGVTTDITSRKLTEFKLRNKEEQLHIALQSAKLGVWTYHIKDGYADVSRTMQQMLDFKETKVTPSEVLSVIHPDDRRRVKKMFFLAARSLSGHFKIECRVVLNEEVRHVEVMGDIFKNPVSGSLARAVGAVKDITERKAEERELEEQRQIALQASKLGSLGELASNIAHEINTPLASIMANGSRIKRMAEKNELNAEKVHDIADSIVAIVKKTAEVITSLKQLARNEDGHKEEVSLREAVTQALSLSRGRFSNHRIQIDFIDKTNGDCEVIASPIQLFQVLVNLLNNAFDALCSQDPSMERLVRISITEIKGGTLQISVSNSGPRILTEVAEKLFSPFFTTKSAGKGTGLGLSISRQLIEKNGGVIFLDTSSDFTCFIIQLPSIERDICHPA